MASQNVILFISVRYKHFDYLCCLIIFHAQCEKIHFTILYAIVFNASILFR